MIHAFDCRFCSAEMLMMPRLLPTGAVGCAGYYSCLSFSMAQLLIEVPYLLGLTVMFTPIVYAMIGLQWTAAKFFWCDTFAAVILAYWMSCCRIVGYTAWRRRADRSH